MLITSTGGNNLIRTNVVANNHGNGIEITGEATGVQVTQAIIGMNTNGQLPLPNGGNGVLIGGDAHGNAIGGFQVSVIPQNVISANLGHGVAITGTAHDNLVVPQRHRDQRPRPRRVRERRGRRVPRARHEREHRSAGPRRLRQSSSAATSATASS